MPGRGTGDGAWGGRLGNFLNQSLLEDGYDSSRSLRGKIKKKERSEDGEQVGFHAPASDFPGLAAEGAGETATPRYVMLF